MLYSLENIAHIRFPFSLVKFNNSVTDIVFSGFWNSLLLRKENFIALALVSSLKLLELFKLFKIISKTWGFPKVPRKRPVKQSIFYKRGMQKGQRERARSRKARLPSVLSSTSAFLSGSNSSRIRQTYKAKCNTWILDDSLFSSSLILLKIDLKHM